MVGTPSAEKRWGVKRAERLCPPRDWCHLPCAGGAEGGPLPMCATLCPLAQRLSPLKEATDTLPQAEV